MTRTDRSRFTAEAREKQLLDVAERLFSEHGFEFVSIEDIARSAGITRPIVYQYFGSLEGVFVACVRRARNELDAALFEAATQDHPGLESAIAAGGRVYFELAEKNPGRWAILFASSASLVGSMSEQLLALRQQTWNRIADIAAQYLPDADRKMLLAAAQVMSGISEQLGRWWIMNPGISLNEVVAMQAATTTGAVRGLFALDTKTAGSVDTVAETSALFTSPSTHPTVPVESVR
jgi:AcrR family transcriptional regulator